MGLVMYVIVYHAENFTAVAENRLKITGKYVPISMCMALLMFSPFVPRVVHILWQLGSGCLPSIVSGWAL